MEQSNEEILISIRRQYEDKEVINALYKLLDEKNNLFKELRTNFGVLVSENDELRHLIKQKIDDTDNEELKKLVKQNNYTLNQEIKTLRNNIKDYMISHKKLKSIRKVLRKNLPENLKIARITNIVFNEKFNDKE